MLGRIRTDAGLTQQELARKMGLSQSTVSDVLRGQRRLDVIEWISFCKACKVTPPQFLEDHSYVSRLEKGSRIPSLDVMMPLARAFQIAPERLMKEVRIEFEGLKR